MSFKKTNVVMLSTNEKSKLVLSYCNELAINWTHDLAKFDDATYQNLYLLSDEEIKEGDWYYDFYNQEVCQSTFNKLPIEFQTQCIEFGNCKKIIATTDKSLITSNSTPAKNWNTGSWQKQYLPQPSTSFIEKFVEEYNKGNVITEVMVEYDMMYKDMTGEHKALMLVGTEYPKLKVNPKDNTITIRKVNDSWNREEMRQKLNDYRMYAKNTNLSIEMFDKWLEQNL